MDEKDVKTMRKQQFIKQPILLATVSDLVSGNRFVKNGTKLRKKQLKIQENRTFNGKNIRFCDYFQDSASKTALSTAKI